MNLNFVFKSPDHLRYENGNHVSGPHGGAGRAVKVEPNVNGCEGYNVRSGDGYIVTVFNMDGNHPVWQNNVQMAPKPMRIVSQDNNMIVLRGFQVQAKSPFGWVDYNGADYGLTIKLKNGNVENCILHMHDRNVDIEYLKDNDQTIGASDSTDTGLDSLKDFVQKWVRELPMNEKVAIARKTDQLNNIGANYYNQNDIYNAIDYFNKALEVMPINDDALQNLVTCYEMTNNRQKMLESQEKLDYLRKIGI